ncbi:MAG: 30S ribosomal protein S17 [Candidatus Doudnabacteria bacterium]|nr:30S ribosomal protein S17 [Candidatus Doudnabacteria bacterium]
MASRKTLSGIVIRMSRNKTAVVKVNLEKRHPQYHKKYTVAKKYKVHDENNTAQVGDKVRIEETRPRSREKHWRIV